MLFALYVCLLVRHQYYYRNSYCFCSVFAAYIRRNTVSYGFHDKIFMPNAVSNRERPIVGGERFLFHDLKYKVLLLIDCSYSHWNDFFGNLVCYWVRNHFIHVNNFRTMSFIPPCLGIPCWEIFSVIKSNEQVLTDSQCNDYDYLDINYFIGPVVVVG